MKEYYIYLNQQEGPLTIEQLRSKNISSDTPAWHEGLKEWITIGEIPELKSLVKATPPPFQTAEQREYAYQLEMEEFFPEKKKISWGIITLFALAVIFFIILVWAMNSR